MHYCYASFRAGFYSYEISTLCHCLFPNNNKYDHCDVADAALYITEVLVIFIVSWFSYLFHVHFSLVTVISFSDL